MAGIVDKIAAKIRRLPYREKFRLVEAILADLEDESTPMESSWKLIEIFEAKTKNKAGQHLAN